MDMTHILLCEGSCYEKHVIGPMLDFVQRNLQ